MRKVIFYIVILIVGGIFFVVDKNRWPLGWLIIFLCMDNTLDILSSGVVGRRIGAYFATNGAPYMLFRVFLLLYLITTTVIGVYNGGDWLFLYLLPTSYYLVVEFLKVKQSVIDFGAELFNMSE